MSVIGTELIIARLIRYFKMDGHSVRKKPSFASCEER